MDEVDHGRRWINRFDDLHIDEIDLVWRQRRRWLGGGIEAYRLALEIRAALGLDEGVAIGFGLGAYARRRTGFTATELIQYLDWIPPSLYLFYRGREPWRWLADPADPLAPIDLDFFALRTLNVVDVTVRRVEGSCDYMEFRRTPADDYARSVLIAS